MSTLTEKGCWQVDIWGVWAWLGGLVAGVCGILLRIALTLVAHVVACSLMGKRINSMFRADVELLQWWADAASKAGMSRNDAFNIILEAVRNSLEGLGREDVSKGLEDFGVDIGEALAMKGLGGRFLCEMVRERCKDGMLIFQRMSDQPGKREALRAFEDRLARLNEVVKNHGK